MRPLPNPGSLCYLISVIYQLYAIPEVRECVCNMRSAHISPAAIRLQKLFLEMSKCESRVGEPVESDIIVDLFEAVQHAVGESDHISSQKDATEFLLDLLTSIRGLPDEENFAQLFLTGEYTNRLTADEGRLQKEMVEKFLFLPLDVEGFDKIDDSLKAFLSPEAVSFRWRTGPNNSLSTSPIPSEKSLMLKQLPKHLIFQLNRFKYDKIRRKKAKIHSRFTFPVMIDMSEFMPCSSASQKTPCLYRLGGVVIHRGSSAHHGHYISFIRTREEQQDAEWRVFDDEHIDPFAEEYLDEECFGKTDLTCTQDELQQEEFDDDASYNSSSTESDGSQGENTPRSAMLLFYDRV